MQAQSETPDASLALAAGTKGQERAAGGCPRWGLERGSAAKETGRGGQGRRGAAQRSAGALSWSSATARRALPPSTTAARHRSPGPGARGIPWGRTPRPQTRSGRQNWARRAARRPGLHRKLSRPLSLAGPCLGPAAPWPNRCICRRRAASEPGGPGRCRTSTLRTRNAGSLDESEGSGLQAFQEHNARSHFAVSATEAQEPLSKGRVLEGSATWRWPLRGSRSIGVRYEAERQLNRLLSAPARD